MKSVLFLRILPFLQSNFSVKSWPLPIASWGKTLVKDENSSINKSKIWNPCTYLYKHVCFIDCHVHPKYALMFLYHLQYINFTKYCQNNAIDDKTQKVHSEEKANCGDKLCDLFANCAFVMPIDHFYRSKDFWIGSVVSHQDNGHICQWNDCLNSFCSHKFLNILFNCKEFFTLNML